MIEDPTETRRETIVDGYAYVSGNGRLVIDRHPTDEEHLLAPSSRTSQPLYDCRVYLSDLVPEEWRNKLGQFLIYRVVNSAGEILAVQLAFIPKEGG